MRAQNQQDLIYKRGQAGVTKASVTIVFDNSDRSASPVGMEDYAQITVTRQVRNFSNMDCGQLQTAACRLPFRTSRSTLSMATNQRSKQFKLSSRACNSTSTTRTSSLCRVGSPRCVACIAVQNVLFLVICVSASLAPGI